jgi:hypothetical protein
MPAEVAADVVGQLVHGAVAPRRIVLHRHQHDVVEVSAQLALVGHAARARRLALRGPRVRGERLRVRQQLEEQHAE